MDNVFVREVRSWLITEKIYGGAPSTAKEAKFVLKSSYRCVRDVSTSSGIREDPVHVPTE